MAERRNAAPKDFDEISDFSHPSETAAKLREFLPKARASGDPEYLAQLLSQIARCLGLQQRFEEAHTTLDEAEGLLHDPTSAGRVRVWLERGRVFNSSRVQGKARELFAQVFSLAHERGYDFYAVDAAHMMEIVETGEEKLKWNLQASSIAERSSDRRARAWLGSLYNNRGWTYHSLGRLTDAIAAFETRIEWLKTSSGAAKSSGTEREIDISRWCIAKMLRLEGRVEEALEIQEDLLAHDPESGYTHEEMAECLLVLGREAAARPHFARAYGALSSVPWIARDEPERLARLERLSRS